ncbi:MAG: hypothetical protein M3R53_05110 [Candidatus Eremiobacteraeota bacterium]|nr:hypothetical protein [Candidatus Eremiobacteraeota bacterium]
MKKLGLLACSAFAAVVLAQGAHASVMLDRSKLKPVYVTLPARGVTSSMLATQAAAVLPESIPFFTSKVTSPLDGATYEFHIVGTNPTNNKVATTINYVPIMLRIHFPDGSVLDPTKPGCNDTVSVEQRFFGSPLFHAVPLQSNGVSVGNTQVVDAFQRAQFWDYVKGSNYHVLLNAAAAPRLVDVNAPSAAQTADVGCGPAHRLGVININDYDNLLVSLVNKYANAKQIPVILSYNVVLGPDFVNCCIIGYHSAYARGQGIQTYANGAYTDPGIFSAPGLQDIHVWVHELGELFDDPFVNNVTPAWGHIGQVAGCQNNLENGDPLTGTAFPVQYHGFTYHPQELVFFDWFYRTPSHGTAGKYSFEGTFQSPQPACTM